MNKCRVCGNDFFKQPLLHYKNMPKAAQFLPDINTLKDDKGISLDVCQCSGCGLVQLSNEPVSYYKEVIRAAGISDTIKKFRVKQFNDFTNKFSLRRKKVIEIGCGCGEYLSLIKKCGMDAYGIEYSDRSVKQCIKNKLKVKKGFIQNSTDKLNDAPFDAFFILNFLEHLPEPSSALMGIHNNLNDDAVGLVEVPNFDMILQKKLFSEFIGDHLFYFTKDTLSSTLKINGFEIIECREIWYDYIISAVVKKRNRLDLKDFYKHQEKIKNDIEKYLHQFKNKKVAIWGAGHQALAIMSLINLADKIEYVVDSAPFKQGKYTPATHIRIVHPDTLNSEPVDAVIIMAGGYSDEVVKIIRQKYDKNINVSILRDYGLEIVQ